MVPGDVVRFGDPQGLLIRGTVLSVDATQLAVRVQEGDSAARYPVASIINVEVLRGTSHMGAAAVGRGALAGMVGGALAGALLGGGNQRGDMYISRGGGAVILGVLGAGAGVLVGAGAAAIPVDDWVAIDLAHPETDRSPGSPRWRAVSVGDTIRLTIGDQLQGDAILLGAGSAELVVAGMANNDTTVVTIATVRKAEVARGIQPGERIVGRASLVGAGIGALLGSGNGGNPALFGVLVGGVGAALGAGVGMLGTIRPEPNWVPFDPDSMTLTAAPYR